MPTPRFDWINYVPHLEFSARQFLSRRNIARRKENVWSALRFDGLTGGDDIDSGRMRLPIYFRPFACASANQRYRSPSGWPHGRSIESSHTTVYRRYDRFPRPNSQSGVAENGILATGPGRLFPKASGKIPARKDLHAHPQGLGAMPIEGGDSYVENVHSRRGWSGGGKTI